MEKESNVPIVPSAPVGKRFAILIVVMIFLIFFVKQCGIMA